MFGISYRAFILTFVCAFSIHIYSQQYGYVQYNSTSGAPFDKVSTVVQDNEGFIWIGSENGLYRFDGIHYDNYSLLTRSQFIHQLQTHDDNLFFVNDLGIYEIEDINSKPRVNVLLEGSIEENDTLPFYPNDILINEKERIWISQSNHTIGRISEEGFKTFRFNESDQAQTLSMQADSENGIWVLSPLDGLFYFNESTDSFEKKMEINNGSTMLVHNELMLIGSDVLHVYDIKGSNPRLIKTISIENDFVSAIHADDHGHFIVGTRKGKLLKFSDLNSPPEKIYGANEAHRVEELNFGYINEIYVRKDDSSDDHMIWICSETGLWLLQQRFFKMVENLPMNNPISIAIGNQGQAWSPMNYLYEISPAEDEFVARSIYDGLQANAVAQDVNGFTWVTTVTPRVELLKYKNDQIVKRYDFHDRGEAIFYLFPDKKGKLWFCQAPVSKPIVGVAMINENGDVINYDETKGFSSRVLAIKESSRGEIYAVGIGENSYLYKYNPEEDRFVNLSPELPFEAVLNFEAHDLTIDDRGIVWLATTDGLLRYDSESISLIENDLLGQEEVRGVTHYSNNNIWIATATKGLVFHQQNTSTALGELEGLPAVISAYRCITTDKDGRLWAGTAEGLVYSRISAASLPYSKPPKIRKIIIQGEKVSEGFDDAFSIKKNQQIQVEFTNLSFPARNVQFQYRLLRKEDRHIMLEEEFWQFVEDNNSLKLHDIEPGDYYLELRARQPGGYQWSIPSEIQFNVFVPWYLQRWVIYGAIGLVILLVSYYFRFYVKRRFKRLQNVLKYSNQKLANKEEQLLQKIREFDEQKAELTNANLNIENLELFIKEIPKQASWNDIIKAMSKAVNKSEDINAFEIAFKERNEIIHKGFSDQEHSGFTFRSKPFNIKNSLTCWAMANDQEVLINDFESEHGLYIQEKEAYRFKSLIFIPFKLGNDQPVVLCAYSIRKNDFDTNDLLMFRILAQFIHFSIHQKLTKKQ